MNMLNLISTVERLTPFGYVRELLVCRFLSLYPLPSSSDYVLNAGDQYAKLIYILETSMYEDLMNGVKETDVHKCISLIRGSVFTKYFKYAFEDLVHRMCDPDSGDVDKIFNDIMCMILNDLNAIVDYHDNNK